MRNALTKPPAEHAFVGAAGVFSEVCHVEPQTGLITYRTRCGLYVTKDRLVAPGRQKAVPCPACQQAREDTP